MAGDRWAPEDLNVLQRYYPTQGAEGVARILHTRTIDAIRHQASRLGLEAVHHKQRVKLNVRSTPHGFEFGPVLVEALCEDGRGGVVLRLSSKKAERDIHVTKGGLIRLLVAGSPGVEPESIHNQGGS